MRALDRWLQQRRIAQALPFVREGADLLDVGCFDRSLIDRVAGRVKSAVGVDVVAEPYEYDRVRILKGAFPEDFDFEAESFDCITLLALFEHLDDPEGFTAACHRLLRPGGRAVLTVPHPLVDRILDVLMALRLIDGMATEEHHGFDVSQTVPIFLRAGFRVEARRRFQLGLNHLFVFSKPEAQSPR